MGCNSITGMNNRTIIFREYNRSIKEIVDYIMFSICDFIQFDSYLEMVVLSSIWDNSIIRESVEMTIDLTIDIVSLASSTIKGQLGKSLNVIKVMSLVNCFSEDISKNIHKLSKLKFFKTYIPMIGPSTSINVNSVVVLTEYMANFELEDENVKTTKWFRELLIINIIINNHQATNNPTHTLDKLIESINSGSDYALDILFIKNNMSCESIKNHKYLFLTDKEIQGNILKKIKQVEECKY